jgi:hypothetical protein
MAAGDAQLLAKYRDALLTQPRPQPVKPCKFCMEKIPLGALVCKFCSREVNTAEEASRLTHAHMEEVVAQRDAQKPFLEVDGSRRGHYHHNFLPIGIATLGRTGQSAKSR